MNDTMIQDCRRPELWVHTHPLLNPPVCWRSDVWGRTRDGDPRAEKPAQRGIGPHRPRARPFVECTDAARATRTATITAAIAAPATRLTFTCGRLQPSGNALRHTDERSLSEEVHGVGHQLVRVGEPQRVGAGN